MRMKIRLLISAFALAGLAGPAAATNPAEDIPARAGDFAFLVGCFAAEIAMIETGLGEWGRPEIGHIIGERALGGAAIRSEWIHFDNPAAPEVNELGHDIRVYDSGGQRWVIASLHAGATQSSDRRARRNGDRIRVWQPYPELLPYWEAEYSIAADGSWIRIEYSSIDDQDWVPVRRIVAVPLSCDMLDTGFSQNQ